MIARDELHTLLDAVPEEQLAKAREALSLLADPVLLAFMTAPDDDEPTTERDLVALVRARKEYARGATRALHDVLTEIEVDA